MSRDVYVYIFINCTLVYALMSSFLCHLSPIYFSYTSNTTPDLTTSLMYYYLDLELISAIVSPVLSNLSVSQDELHNHMTFIYFRITLSVQCGFIEVDKMLNKM